MADVKISEMTSAVSVDETDNLELSQENSGVFTSVKASILAIANKIATGINFTSALQTTNKTLTGAINEAAQSGGSGGHTILNDGGSALSQEDNLQFVGVYSEDDSVNEKTVVNVVREMTQAQYDLLSAAEKKGIIRITDKSYVCEADDVMYDATNNVTVETELDSKEDWVSNGVLGAKNLLNFPYYETTHSENGVDWTVYSDGTVMANGKAVGGYSSLTLRANGDKITCFQEGETYVLTGCPSGGGLSTYGIRIYCRDSSNTNLTNSFDTGEGVSFTVPKNSGYDHDYGFIRVYEGATVDNLIFKPMVRLASDTDTTHRPYTMTNKELTDIVNYVPDTAGTYTLQATRNADGTITYSWVSSV